MAELDGRNRGHGAGGRGDAAGPGRAGASPTSELAGVGLQFAAVLLVFVFAGVWLDRRAGTSPLFVLLGVFVGAAGAIYSMYRKLTGAAGRRRGAGEGEGDGA